MAWALGTKTGMTVSGMDLVLDEGRAWGTYETTAVDIATLCWRRFDALVKVSISGADASAPRYSVEIKTSPDNVNWTAYTSYRDGEIYCRCYQMKITIWGDPSFGQRPALNQFEVSGPPCDAVPWQGNVLTTETTPPAAAKRGDRYLVGVGAGAWVGKDGWLAICEEAGTGFRLIPPVNGMQFYHADEDVVKLYDSTAGWVDADVRKTSAPHITMMAPAWSAKTAGTWGPLIDTAHLYNGVYTNTSAANLDALTFRTGLKRIAYTLVLFGLSDVDGGIVKVYLDAVLVATFDMCDIAGPTRNIEYRQATITPASAKVYDVKVKVDGKNGASSGYKCWLSHLSFYPE